VVVSTKKNERKSREESVGCECVDADEVVKKQEVELVFLACARGHPSLDTDAVKEWRGLTAMEPRVSITFAADEGNLLPSRIKTMLPLATDAVEE
jgi:hypothetical protein